MVLVTFFILAQKEETLNLQKTEKLLKPQNKVSFVTTHRNSSITAYDSKVSTDSSTAFVGAETKVWAAYNSGSYIIINFIFFPFVNWN